MSRPEFRPWLMAGVSLLYIALSLSLLAFYMVQAKKLTQYLTSGGESAFVAILGLAFIALVVVFFTWALYRIVRPAIYKCYGYIRKSHESL